MILNRYFKKMPHSTGQIICCEQQYPRNKDQHRLQMHMPRHLKQCIVTKQQNVYKMCTASYYFIKFWDLDTRGQNFWKAMRITEPPQ